MNRYRLIEILVKIILWIAVIALLIIDAAGLIEPLSDRLEIFINTIGFSILIILLLFMPSKMADRELDKGLKYLDKDNDKAVRYINKYLGSKMLIDIERRNGLRILGVAHHKRGDDKAAVHCLNKALEGHYKDNDLKVELLGAIGIIYSESGDYQKAVEYFDRTFDIIFSISKAHIDNMTIIQVANAYINAGKKEKAVMIYDRLLLIQGFKRDKRVEELLGI